MKKTIRIITIISAALALSPAYAKSHHKHPSKPQLVCVAPKDVQKRPTGVSNSWEFLHYEYAERLNNVLTSLKEAGYEPIVLEGYRSPERQNELMEGGKFTQAKSFQSYHQFGLAADIAFLKKGKPVLNLKEKWVMDAYKLYGELAEKNGLVWGGKWTMKDYGHTELQLRDAFKIAYNYPDTKHKLITIINQVKPKSI